MSEGNSFGLIVNGRKNVSTTTLIYLLDNEKLSFTKNELNANNLHFCESFNHKLIIRGKKNVLIKFCAKCNNCLAPSAH